MVLERKLSKQLEDWFNSSNRKPLILEGTTQVGKTYLVKELFLKRKFSNYVYINLSKDYDSLDFFKHNYNPSEYISYIESRFGKKLSNDLPLVIDDIQECPLVLVALKSFYQQHIDIPIIGIGSCIKQSIKNHTIPNTQELIDFPSDCVDTLTLYSLTFEEYLINTNPDLLEIIKDAYYKKEALEDDLHEHAKNVLLEYLKIGGLPKVVNTYLTSGSYDDASELIKEYYDEYMRDIFSQHISHPSRRKASTVFQKVGKLLMSFTKNFKVQKIGKFKSHRDYADAYEALISSHFIHKSQSLKDEITYPFTTKNSSIFRLYLTDVGLLQYQIKNDETIRYRIEESDSIFCETMIVSEFVTRNIPLFFWNGIADNRVDFVVKSNNNLYGINISKYFYDYDSINNFKDANKGATSIIFDHDYMSYDIGNRNLYVPYYETFLVAEDLAKGRYVLDL